MDFCYVTKVLANVPPIHVPEGVACLKSLLTLATVSHVVLAAFAVKPAEARLHCCQKTGRELPASEVGSARACTALDLTPG